MRAKLRQMSYLLETDFGRTPVRALHRLDAAHINLLVRLCYSTDTTASLERCMFGQREKQGKASA